MFLSIQINYENATFYDDPVSEIACVLAEVVAFLRANGTEQGSRAKLHDTDGNPVGDYVFTVSKGSRPLNAPRRAGSFRELASIRQGPVDGLGVEWVKQKSEACALKRRLR
jgi:hypothetical protein